jgi:serine protease SohB
MSMIMEILGFAGKGLIVFITFAACAVVLFSRLRFGRGGAEPEGQLFVRHLNDTIRHKVEGLRAAMLPPKERKKHHKELVKVDKLGPAAHARNVFVLDFKGDILASAVESLREEITAVVGVAGDKDEVVLRLESGGGAAHSYGFAASQLMRLRERGLKLTVCIDRIAASGGYMMACVGDEIVAAPFAILGSIGVVAPLPNVHRLLDRMGVDYENAIAGKYKRTVSPFAAINDHGRQKFQEQIEEMHDLFKRFVHDNRPQLDMDEVGTGEHWQGTRALELGLCNRLSTSDDVLMSQLSEANIYRVNFRRPLALRDRLGGAMATIAERLLDTFWSRWLTAGR